MQASIEWELDGMTCTNCALTVKKYLAKNGIENADVNFATQKARFEVSENTNLDLLSHGLKQIGYTVTHQHGAASGHQHGNSVGFTVEKRFWICAFFTIPLLAHMIFPIPFFHEPIIQMLLCLPVMFIGWFHFGRSAFYSLKSRSTNMDVLIALGSGAAFAYSLYGTIYNLGPNFIYFETSATIITLVLLGNVIEKRSVRQTTTTLEELSKLQQTKAKLLKINLETGQEEIVELASSDIMPGYRLQVNNGDSVPIDGIILKGKAKINEAMLSGESDPVLKNVGDKVIGGTLVLDGQILMKATQEHDHTLLAQIIDLVKTAQAESLPIQRLADKISAWFVPLVLGIAFIAFTILYFLFNKSFETALLQSIAVLVISCPCAMGLATPTAVMVGIGRAAKNGILVRSAKVFELFYKTKIWVFDKTGTLTSIESNLEEQLAQLSEESLSVLYTLESKSSHPIAKSICQYIKVKSPMQLENIAEVKGQGIMADDIAGNKFRIGSAKFTNHTGQSSIYITKNDILLGSLILHDSLRSGAKELIEYCFKNNIQPILLSGDTEQKCKTLADQLGIGTVYAGKSPAEKLEIIASLKKKGLVAMIGDGINDAPALAAADVSISPGDATAVALSSSGITLLSSSLQQIISARELSGLMLKTIKQNLFWAFAYNIVAIPLAAAGFLSPMLSALSMAFSDVVVIGNSVLLRFKKMTT